MATSVVTEVAAPRRWRLKLPERLPVLKGKWLTAYSILWMAIAAIAIVGTIAGTIYRLRSGAGQSYTFARLGLDCEDKGTIVRSVAGDSIGIVHRGDAVLFVNGVRMPKDPTAELAQSIAANNELLVPEGTRVQLTVGAPRDHPRTVVLTSRRENAEALYAPTGLTPNLVTWLCTLGLLLAPLILFASGFLLYGRRRDPVAALLSLCLIAWSCNFASANAAWLRWIGSAYQAIGASFGTLGISGLALVFLTFPRGRFEPRWTAVLALLLPVFLLTVVFPDSTLLNDGFIPVILAAVVSMVVRYRRIPVAERQEWKWALLGFTLSIGLIMLWIFVYSPYLERHSGMSNDLWSWVLTPAFAFVCMLLLVGGVTLSVLRYRLYDTSAAVSRSAAYGVLTLGFVALFAGTEKLAEIVGERYFEHSIGIVAGAVGAAVAAAVVVPLHNRVHRWAERRFQKPLIRLRDGLPELVADLRESAPVDQLVSAVMSRVEAGVRSTREAVLLREEDTLAVADERNVAANTVEEWLSGWQPPLGEQALDCGRHDPMFPLRVRLCIESGDEPETIGWLLLGPRPDGSFFGRDEREALIHVAGPVARAIHIAQLRQGREANAESRLSTLEALIDELAAAIGRGPAAANA